MLFLARMTIGLTIIFTVISIIGQFFTDHPANFSAVFFAAALAVSAWFGWKALKPELLTLPKFIVAHFTPVGLAALGFIPLFAPNKIGSFIIGGLILIGVFSLVLRQLYVQRKLLKLSSSAANESFVPKHREVHSK